MTLCVSISTHTHACRNCELLKAKTLVRLEQVEWTWSAVKVLWLNMWLWLSLYWFYDFFLNIITNSWFTSWLLHCALFSCASFWCHQSVFGVVDRTSEALCFAYRSRKNFFNVCGLNHFGHQLFLNFVEWTFDDVLQHSKIYIKVFFFKWWIVAF